MQKHTVTCDQCGDEIPASYEQSLGVVFPRHGIQIQLKAGSSKISQSRDFCSETCLCGWLLAHLHANPNPQDLHSLAISESDKIGNEHLNKASFASGFLAGWMRGRQLPDDGGA